MPLPIRRDGNALFVTLPAAPAAGTLETVTVAYHGTPRVALNAPWDGGVVWTADSLGRPWIATAVQGLGASAWWPVKDTQTDEPDSQRVAITVPTGMMDVSNGRLRQTTVNRDGTTTYTWAVVNPINTYDVAVNAGHYAHFGETYAGEAGPLALDFYPLDYNEARARRQFQQVAPDAAVLRGLVRAVPVVRGRLQARRDAAPRHGAPVGRRVRQRLPQRLPRPRPLAHRHGPLVGLHHRPRVRPRVVGQQRHERDIADMWVHESFANYAENLYVECQQGAAAGAAYVLGTRASIRNDVPIVGPFGVAREGSGDMYYKGGNLLHTVRQIVGDDARWRATLRGLQARFRHQRVSGADSAARCPS